MAHDNIDTEHLEVTGKKPGGDSVGSINFEDEVTIVVSQAFGPTGENLVGISEVTFDGFPALTLRVVAEGREELVHLSPIHGDRRKRGFDGLTAGSKCELLCPVSREPLPRIGRIIDDADAEYFAIYLTPKLDRGSTIYVSDVWGHHHSRIVDNNELISYWAAAEERG